MQITTYPYVLVHVMHTVHHIHKPNWKQSEDGGKMTVSHGKIEETALLKASVGISGLKHLSFLLGGKGCCLSFISCSTWYGGSIRTDTLNWDEFSIF